MIKKGSSILLSIELARGWAALMIFVFHLLVLGHERYGVFNVDLTPWIPFLSGHVDLFFFISGFIMAQTTQTAPSRNPASFLLKRFIRIFPAYWLVLAGQIILMRLKPDHAPDPNATASLFHSIFLLPDTRPTILMVAWTLIFEIYFYLAFAATLFLPRRKQLFLLIAFFLFSVAAGYLLQPGHPALLTATSSMLLEFAIGMMLSLMWPIFPRQKILLPIFLAAAALWFIVAPFSDDMHLLSCGVPFLFIFLAFLSVEKTSLPIPKKPALFLGGISYALYLVHVPVILGLPVLARVLHLSLPSAFMLTMAILLCLLTASFLHYVFEVLTQRFLRRIFKLHSQPPQSTTLNKISNI